MFGRDTFELLGDGAEGIQGWFECEGAVPCWKGGGGPFPAVPGGAGLASCEEDD